MKTRLFGLVATLALFYAGSFARAVDIYVLTNGVTNFTASQSTDFGRVDTSTGVYTSIVSLSGGIGNLAWNPAADNFFVTKYNSTGSTYELRTLTKTGALSDALGSFGNRPPYGMVYRTADSNLYAYDYQNDVSGKIDPSNGAWTTLNSSLGTSASTPVGGHYTIMNDTTYFAFDNGGNGVIGTMGYTASSPFQLIAVNNFYKTMNLASDGTTLYGLYGDNTAGNQKLYTINPVDGTLTAGPSIAGAGLGKFFKGTAVPEPSTYILAAIASGVMAAAARRRKARRA